jgi:hypothetical protein
MITTLRTVGTEMEVWRQEDEIWKLLWYAHGCAFPRWYYDISSRQLMELRTSTRQTGSGE